MLVVQVSVLVVLRVVLVHALIRPQASWWRVKLLLRVVNPLERDENRIRNEKKRKPYKSKEVRSWRRK